MAQCPVLSQTPAAHPASGVQVAPSDGRAARLLSRCLMGWGDESHEALAYPDFSGNLFLMAGTPFRCTKKARTFSFTYEAWKKT